VSCRLIINVDDYGWSEGVNEAVCRLYDAGIVTSTSLMVAGPALSEGLERLENRPGLAVGLHVALVAAPSVLPPQGLRHIVDERGWLSSRHARAGLGYSLLPAWRSELARETAAQFHAFARLGLPWSHVDSHRHFHLTPALFREMLRHSREYGASGFRVPEDDWQLYHRMDPVDARKQRTLARVFSLLAGRQRSALRDSGFTLTDRCYGLFRTGRLDAEYLAELVGRMPDGLHELHCHPDVSTEKGQAEFEALASPAFRGALEKREVRLTTYLAERTA
jgi:hopanoid biosynthesis associated protein HpnK